MYTIDAQEHVFEIAKTLGWNVNLTKYEDSASEDQWIVSNRISEYVAAFYSKEAAWDYISYRLGAMPYLNMETNPQEFRPPMLTEMLSYRHPNISREEYSEEAVNFFLWTEKDTNKFETNNQSYTMTVAIGYKNSLRDDKISHEIFRHETSKNNNIDLHVLKLECLFEIYQKFLAWKSKQD